jgi:hypothetical protein
MCVFRGRKSSQVFTLMCIVPLEAEVLQEIRRDYGETMSDAC